MSTTRTSKADYNYYSLTPEGATLFAGSDHAAPAQAPLENGAFFTPPSPGEYDAIFKTSRIDGVKLTGMLVEQGRENSLDANDRCRNSSFEGEFGLNGESEIGGDQIITTKGGCHHIRYAGHLWSKGRRADVVVGQWSDQSHDVSYELDYSGLSRADGAPVTFILSRVNSPIMAALGRPKDIKLPKNAKVLFWKSVGDQAYYWLKFAAVKLHLLPSK